MVGVKRKKQEEGSFLVGEWRMKEEESQGRGFRPCHALAAHNKEVLVGSFIRNM